MASKHLTLEQQNFVRLSLAGVDEARVVLGYVLHSQILPKDIVNKIQANAILSSGPQKLKPEQKKLCCIPGPGVPDYKTFDITLLYKLIRNLCSSLQPSQGWGKEPRPTENNIGDDIERLRFFRNEMIGHANSSSVPGYVFQSKWNELENIFKRIQGFLTTQGNPINLVERLESIKSTDFGWQDYDKCQIHLKLECIGLTDAPKLTLEGGERKTCGESACFVVIFGDGEMSNNWPITWQRIKGNITEQLDTSAERYKGSSSQQLVIPKVSKEDEGEYRATVSREEKGTHIQIPSNTIYLTVTGDLPNLKMNAVSDKNNIAICYIISTNDESSAVNRVVWSKDGEPLDENADKYSGGSLRHTYLTIHSPTSTDIGQYSCEVFNEVGSVKKAINLDFPSAFINDKLTAEVGDSVTITATIRSSPTLLSAKWQKSSDETIDHFTDIDINDPRYFGSTADREDPKLCIPKTTREDGIFYRLVVSNGLGQCESNMVFLKLVGEPRYTTNTTSSTEPTMIHNAPGTSGEQITLINNEEDAFALPPLDATGFPNETMKLQLSDTSDIITTLDLAPPTKKLMQRKEIGGVETLLALPGRAIISRTLSKLFSRNLKTQQAKEEEESYQEPDKKEKVPDEVKKQIQKQGIDFLSEGMSSEHERYHSGIAQILKVPVELLGMSKEDIKTFVINYKRGSTKVYCGRGMVVGCFGAGKTTLVKKLRGEDVSSPIASTRGLEVHTNIFIVDQDETGLTVNEDQKSGQRLYINLESLESDNKRVNKDQNSAQHLQKHSETLESGVVNTSTDADHTDAKADAEIPTTSVPEIITDIQHYNELTLPKIETGKGPVRHSVIIEQITEKDVDETEANQQVQRRDEDTILSNVSNKSVKTISLLDFAGQGAYYACHHIFLSPRTFYILVTDMSKKLIVTPTEAAHTRDLMYGGWTHQDYINHWLGSIHTYSSDTAPVILIQSHSEGKEKEEENTYFRDVKLGVTKVLQTHLRLNRSYPVEKDSDKNMQEIKTCMLNIVKNQSHWGESIPTSWVHLEACLMEIKNQQKVVKKKNLWKTLPSQIKKEIPSEEDMTTALKLFNDIGVILYTSSSESIILDVQWFVDAFKVIITDEDHAQHDIENHFSEWIEFSKNGILPKDLVKEIWIGSESFTKYTEDLLLHMIRLGMIAKMGKGARYYVPCMNKQKYDRDVLRNCACSSTICFMFEYLPLVIFHRLIATCMTNDGWEIWNGNNMEKTGQTSECVFHTAAMLEDKDDLKMLIGITEKKKNLFDKKNTHPYSIEIQGFVFKDQQMQKQFPRSKLESIKKHLKDLTSCFEANRSMTFRIGYRCSIAPFSDTPDSHIILESSKECASCRKTEGIDNLKSFWMADATSENETTEIAGKKRQMERPFLDEARFTADIHTGYGILLSVVCLSDDRVWTCGDDNNTMKLLTVQGQLLSSVQTKSGGSPEDITVTGEGDLVYTDYTDRTINLVRNKQTRTIITLQGWEPHCVCCTASHHLLVTMDSDDGQHKVVRYSGSTATQTIQYDQGRRLYSYAAHISENRNLDICVADLSASAVVVVNQSGKLRFRYTGHPSNTGESFYPAGITTDSQSHILTSDPHNGRIHILDQDGQFLRYIHNLHRPWGLCVDSRDNLFVAEEYTAKVKRIQYLESQR